MIARIALNAQDVDFAASCVVFTFYYIKSLFLQGYDISRNVYLATLDYSRHT